MCKKFQVFRLDYIFFVYYTVLRRFPGFPALGCESGKGSFMLPLPCSILEMTSAIQYFVEFQVLQDTLIEFQVPKH